LGHNCVLTFVAERTPFALANVAGLVDHGVAQLLVYVGEEALGDARAVVVQKRDVRAMLQRLKRGEFVGIVTDETSRVTRNQSELHRLVAELRFRNQFLITCDGIDTRSEASEIVPSVKAAVDAMEGKKIGYRTYRSLRERHKDGHCSGGRIYGYGIVSDGDYKRRVPNPEQAAIVLEIFERYAKGESAKTIVRDLNERRIPSPGSAWKGLKRRSVGWVHTTVLGSYSKGSGILRNPTYAGLATWNKRAGKKVPGTGRGIRGLRGICCRLLVCDCCGAH